VVLNGSRNGPAKEGREARSVRSSPIRRGKQTTSTCNLRGESRADFSSPIVVAQYSWLAQGWVASIGLNSAKLGTHSLRRTKAPLIYRRTGNLRAVQLLLGHSKIESTVRYLGIEVDDAIEIEEKLDI
jgi:integrase